MTEERIGTEANGITLHLIERGSASSEKSDSKRRRRVGSGGVLPENRRRTVPYGAWTLHHLQWAQRQNDLHHSAGYSDPKAIDLVIDWLSLRLLDISAT